MSATVNPPARGAMTVRDALDTAARRLAMVRVPQPRHEARLLLGAAAVLPVEALIGYPERALDADALHRFADLVGRRAGREPIAQILGRREFWSLDFRVTADTLTPRPESETLVEAALDLIPDRQAPLRLLDLGTGTGCLLLALLSELPAAIGIGVDVSEVVCRVARDNAEALGLAERARFLVGDWGASLGGRFDLVVSNPPYIVDREIAALEPEIARFEPRLALAGGPDGLDAYRALAPGLAQLLAPGGHALLELGQGQDRAVADIMAAAGLSPAGQRLDLAGIERCLIMAARAAPAANRGEAWICPDKAVAQRFAFCYEGNRRERNRA